MMKVSRWQIVVAIGVLLVSAAVLFQLRALFIPLTSQSRFHHETWIRADPSDPNSPRIKMIEDIGRTILVPGTDKSVVLNKLGKPEGVKRPEDFGTGVLPPDVKFVWCYSVGNWSGFRIDPDYLGVGISSEGKVVMYWLWQS